MSKQDFKIKQFLSRLYCMSLLSLHCEEKTFVGWGACVNPLTWKKEQHLKQQVRQ